MPTDCKVIRDTSVSHICKAHREEEEDRDGRHGRVVTRGDGRTASVSPPTGAPNPQPDPPTSQPVPPGALRPFPRLPCPLGNLSPSRSCPECQFLTWFHLAARGSWQALEREVGFV